MIKFLDFIKKIKDNKIVDNFYGKPIIPAQEGNDLISTLLEKNQPLMIARIGHTELSCLKHYLKGRNNSNKGYPQNVKTAVSECSGFFPTDDEMIDRFCKDYLLHLESADILGIWFYNYEDFICHNFSKNAALSKARSIESYYHLNPWTSKLKDKKVLVIHPFEETILSQYKNKRELLFNNHTILPNFHLQTVKAVQSIADNQASFKNWFMAYEYMCDAISKRDFDIAIIGAGAYGLPLASFVKNLGKVGIQVGGPTQILFGIKGRRWDNHEFISKLYNQHWVRPSKDETPHGHKKVESGCYW